MSEPPPRCGSLTVCKKSRERTLRGLPSGNPCTFSARAEMARRQLIVAAMPVTLLAITIAASPISVSTDDEETVHDSAAVDVMGVVCPKGARFYFAQT